MGEGKFLKVEPGPRLFGHWILLSLSGLGGVVIYRGLASNGGASSLWGELLLHIGRESFWTTSFVPEPSWQPFSIGKGAILAMQMNYNESRGYPGAEVEEESAYFACMPLGLLTPKVLEPTRSEGCATRLLWIYLSLSLPPAHASVIPHWRIWDSASGYSFHCSLSFYPTFPPKTLGPKLLGKGAMTTLAVSGWRRESEFVSIILAERQVGGIPRCDVHPGVPWRWRCLM